MEEEAEPEEDPAPEPEPEQKSDLEDCKRNVEILFSINERVKNKVESAICEKIKGKTLEVLVNGYVNGGSVLSEALNAGLVAAQQSLIADPVSLNKLTIYMKWGTYRLGEYISPKHLMLAILAFKKKCNVVPSDRAFLLGESKNVDLRGLTLRASEAEANKGMWSYVSYIVSIMSEWVKKARNSIGEWVSWLSGKCGKGCLSLIRKLRGLIGSIIKENKYVAIGIGVVGIIAFASLQTDVSISENVSKLINPTVEDNAIKTQPWTFKLTETLSNSLVSPLNTISKELQFAKISANGTYMDLSIMKDAFIPYSTVQEFGLGPPILSNDGEDVTNECEGSAKSGGRGVVSLFANLIDQSRDNPCNALDPASVEERRKYNKEVKNIEPGSLRKFTINSVTAFGVSVFIKKVTPSNLQNAMGFLSTVSSITMFGIGGFVGRSYLLQNAPAWFRNEDNYVRSLQVMPYLLKVVCPELFYAIQLLPETTIGGVPVIEGDIAVKVVSMFALLFRFILTLQDKKTIKVDRKFLAAAGAVFSLSYLYVESDVTIIIAGIFTAMDELRNKVLKKSKDLKDAKPITIINVYYNITEEQLRNNQQNRSVPRLRI